MVRYWRLRTDITTTSDELGIKMRSLFGHGGLEPSCLDGIIMSSVVPSINFTVDHMCRDYFGLTPMQVAPGVKTGVNIRYENPESLEATGLLTPWRAMRFMAARRFLLTLARPRRLAC